MAKQWYFQVMGSEVGPVAPSVLRERALAGHIQPDTPVKLGHDGRWVAAERVTGLFDPVAAPVKVPAPVASEAAPAAVSRPAKTMKVVGAELDSDQSGDEAASHVTGVSHAPTEAPAHSEEYEFFQFVAFRSAISPALHDVLMAYVAREKQSVTQVTRRALAEFLGRKDLVTDQPPETNDDEAESIS